MFILTPVTRTPKINLPSLSNSNLPKGGAFHIRNENMEMGTRLEMKAFIITAVSPATLFNERESLFLSLLLCLRKLEEFDKRYRMSSRNSLTGRIL